MPLFTLFRIYIKTILNLVISWLQFVINASKLWFYIFIQYFLAEMTECTNGESSIKRCYKRLINEKSMIPKPSSAPYKSKMRTKAIDMQRKRSKSDVESSSQLKVEIYKPGMKKSKEKIQETVSAITLTENKSLVLDKKRSSPNQSVIRFLQTIDNVDQLLKIEMRLEDLEQKFKMVSSVLEKDNSRKYKHNVVGEENDLATTVNKGFIRTVQSPPLFTENIFEMNAKSTVTNYKKLKDQSFYTYPEMQFCPPSSAYLRRNFTLRNPFCLNLSETVH